MRQLNTKWILVFIWLFGFIFCLVVPISWSDWFPGPLNTVLNQVFETFAPTLTIMFAFIFSEQITELKKEEQNTFVSTLAIILSLFYVGLFSAIMLRFALDKIQVPAMISLYSELRPKTSFLISGMVAYYFASRKESKTAGVAE